MTMKLSHAEVDDLNAKSQFFYQLHKDTPGKFWALKCKSPLLDDLSFKSLAKVLNLDANDPMTGPAVYHMRLGKVDDVYQIVTPYPIPNIEDGTHLDIDQVLLWNPKTNQISIMGDDTPQIFGAVTDKIYGDPKRFLQDWACNLAMQFTAHKSQRDQKWKSAPQEVDCCPGALIVGDLAKIRWPLMDMPKRIECFDIDAKKVSSAILKSANLPWCIQGK